MGPTSKKNKNKKEVRCEMVGRTLRGREKREVFNFFSFLGFSQIQGKSSVRIRRDKHGKCST